MHRMHGAASPEAMKERMAAGVDRALSRVNATDEQRVKVKTIMKEGMADIVSMRETHVANRETMLLSLAGETVDRDRLEAARRSEIEIAERASVRMARMLADAAEVLTPEQRRSLVDVLRRMRGPLGFGPGIPPDPHDGRHDPGRS
ncbi:MAG: Spy/CpxP family protein refolding chaperone [Betaproteobacteria bacterium]|nr:Spy/CpxP family protein refolding chaperone [Betaproteobacteria bacterium]